MRPSAPITYEQALARAEELCARAEHSSGEIRHKLYLWKLPADRHDELIDSLIDRRFIDDARFARAYARDKMEYAGWGRRKIAVSLATKGVGRTDIAEALAALDSRRYEARLQSLITAKRRTMDDPTSYENRVRIFRFAAARGFEPDLISKVIGDLM